MSTLPGTTRFTATVTPRCDTGLRRRTRPAVSRWLRAMPAHPTTTGLYIDVAEQAPDLDHHWETQHAPDASPLSGPTRLSAAATPASGVRALPRRPRRARPDSGPAHAAHRRRRRPGRRPAHLTTNHRPCLLRLPQPGSASVELDSLDTSRLYPALLLGGLPGYQSEIPAPHHHRSWRSGRHRPRARAGRDGPLCKRAGTDPAYRCASPHRPLTDRLHDCQHAVRYDALHLPRQGMR